RMGTGIVLAVALGAIIVFNVVRSICPLLGVSASESLFVAGMLVASSSAILGRIIGILLVFVTVVVVVGLLLLPRSLQRLNRAGTDLLTITVAGLVLG